MRMATTCSFEGMWLAVYAFWLILATIAAAAWRWGNCAERAVAAMYAAAAIATVIVRAPGSSDYSNFDNAAFAIDCCLLVGLLCVLARHSRWWLVGSAAIQCVTVLGHVAMFDEPTTSAFAYFTTVVASSYPSVFLLAIAVSGTARSRMRSAPNSTVS